MLQLTGNEQYLTTMGYGVNAGTRLRPVGGWFPIPLPTAPPVYGLTGKVLGNQVDMFATHETVADTDQTYLYEVTDSLVSTTGA